MKKSIAIFLFVFVGSFPLNVLSQIIRGHLTGQVTLPVSGVPLTFTAQGAITKHLLNKSISGRKNVAHSLISSNRRSMREAGRRIQVEPMGIQLYSKTVSRYVDSVDLSPFAPPVANQQYPVCYAYASVYAARTILYNKAHHITWQPDSTVFSTTFLQKVMCANVAVCETNGFDTYKACQILRDSGSVFKNDFPGDDCAFDTITATLRKKALRYRVNANMIFRPCDSDAEKNDSIKVSLVRGLPVIVTWISTDSFNARGNWLPLWQPDSTDYNLNVCRDTTNHSFCVVGFNNIKNGGAFLVMNSWGTEWGTDGFMWIKYSDMAHFAAFGIVLSNLDKKK